MSESERKLVIDYVKTFYEENNEAPSIAAICRQVPRMYREKFYGLFPGKIEEVCRAVGIPAPSDRIEATEKATEAKAEPPEKAKSEGPRITLNAEQTRLVYGLCHLEKAKDSSVLLDEVLRRDEEFRNAGMGLEETAKVLDLLKEMAEVGWKPNQVVIFINNAGRLMPSLTPQMADDLIAFLRMPYPPNVSVKTRFSNLMEALMIQRMYANKVPRETILEFVKH